MWACVASLAQDMFLRVIVALLCAAAGFGEDTGGMAAASSEIKSAVEHQPLRELTQQSGGIGTWLLFVAETPRVREYEHTWNWKTCKGKAENECFIKYDGEI